MPLKSMGIMLALACGSAGCVETGYTASPAASGSSTQMPPADAPQTIPARFQLVVDVPSVRVQVEDEAVVLADASGARRLVIDGNEALFDGRIVTAHDATGRLELRVTERLCIGASSPTPWDYTGRLVLDGGAPVTGCGGPLPITGDDAKEVATGNGLSPHGGQASTQALIAVYGSAATRGIGSAVFTAEGATTATLEAQALERYRTFVGDGWNKRMRAWRGSFKELYRRASADKGAIDRELHAIKESELRGVVAAMIDDMESPATARAALAGAFDRPDVRELRLYSLGDGEQIAGVQVAAMYEGGNSVFLVMLLD